MCSPRARLLTVGHYWSLAKCRVFFTSHLKAPHPPIRALAGDCGDFHLIYTEFWFPGRREIARRHGLRIPYRVICWLLKDQSVYFMAASSVC